MIAAFGKTHHLDHFGAGLAGICFELLLWEHRSPKHQQFANVLDGSGVKALCQVMKHELSVLPVVAEHPNLDESMGGQCGVGFFDQSGGEAVCANVNHGLQGVGVGAVGTALMGESIKAVMDVLSLHHEIQSRSGQSQ